MSLLFQEHSYQDVFVRVFSKFLLWIILWTLSLKYFYYLFTAVNNFNLIIIQELSQVPGFRQKFFQSFKKRFTFQSHSGWRHKKPPTSFSHATSTNVEISPKTFWLLILTLLPLWCKMSRPYLVSVPNYWVWTKGTPQKSWFFQQS